MRFNDDKLIGPKGLAYWQKWIESYKEWLQEKPPGLDLDDYLSIKNVAYQDLDAISEHFEVRKRQEDYSHRQSVEIEFSEKQSITFHSPKRGYTYDQIDE